MLYVQFSPLVPLSSIILFSWLDPYSSTMRLGLNMMQMYTSALMCYNTHLVPEHQKYFLPFATFIAALNLVPESFAIVSPYLMIGANLLFPYIDRKELELEEESKEESVKTLLKVHGIIYFFLVFVSLMRLKIFLETNAMEK